MNRNTLPLCMLVLTGSLASCAPALRGSQGQDRLIVVSGGALKYLSVLPAEQVTDATPDGSYATFSDCPGAAVSVEDLRRVGPEAADQACRERASADTSQNPFGGLLTVLGAVTAAFLIFILIEIPQFFKAIFASSVEVAPKEAA